MNLSAWQELWGVSLWQSQPQAIWAPAFMTTKPEIELSKSVDCTLGGALGLGMEASRGPQLASQ